MKKMERKVSDNKYLHKDFHVSFDLGLAYIGDKFGKEHVSKYLRDYARSYYKKMTLNELDNYFKFIYEQEEASDLLETELEDKSLKISVKRCPAMEFMRSQNHEPSKYYAETTKTLYKELAQICGFEFELIEYDDTTGKAEFIFKEASA